MSIRGWLLLACGGFGATYLVGEFFDSPLLPSAQLLAWVSLVAYVAVAGPDAPVRVRVALAAGLLILGAFAVVPLLSTVDSGSGGGLQFLSPARGPRLSTLEMAAKAVRDVAPVLVAYSCLALAALFLPKRRTRAGIAVAAVGTGLAVTYVGLELWNEDGGLAAAIGAVPPLLAAVFAFVMAGRVSRWLPTAGLALLGLAALWLLDDVLDRIYVYAPDAFLQPGLRYSGETSAAVLLVAPVTPTTVGWALAPAIQLAAAAAVTAGCLRRHPRPEVEP